jgi:probable HAF family extracellular repeat protein
VTNLGALRSAVENCSDASAVNSTGEIVGGSENGVIDPLLGVTEIRAVLWKDGDIEDLGTFGGNDSQATAINNRGQVAGWALNSIPDPFSNLGTQQRPFLWQHGAMHDLGDLGGPDGLAVFVNERGQVAGASLTNSTPNPITGFPTVHPFLWEDGTMVDLGSLGGTLGFPNALNNRGQVIGSMFIPGDLVQDMFLWDEGKLIDLTAKSGGTIVTANAIDDAGEIVGAAAFSTNRPFDAYLWKHGVVTDLGTLPGDCFSQAFAINAEGQVVGQSIACDFSTRSFLWDNGSMVDLNTFVPPGSGLQLVEAVAINDRGEIAGDLVPPSCTGNPQGQDTQCGHAYVLIPCNDEHSDEGGCEDEGGSGAFAVQGRPAPVPQNSIRLQDTLTPRERAARMLSRRGHYRSLGIWQRQQP